MLSVLKGSASRRKLRLFACACCRAIWDLMTCERDRQLVEASEAYADGTIRRKVLMERRKQAHREESDLAHWAAMSAARPEVSATWVAYLAADARDRPGIHHGFAPTVRQSTRQADLLRDIFGNPFRPVSFDPAWRTPTVIAVAETIYAERRFEDMPVLADALQEAGCTAQEILDHCRVGVEHVRGCWVLDLILSKDR
jgi:hypothetical protein